MLNEFRLVMIGAMYENGGNVTHRLLDGHPQMRVYPFESQLGTRLVVDPLTSMFPVKYRWPCFALDASPAEDYHAIIDEECKVRARTPHVSKFRHMNFDFSDDDRKTLYIDYISESGRSRAANVAAFFRASFDAWKDRTSTGAETVYVGYSPIVTVDSDRILADFPKAHVVHVVRNPWSAYADTRKRPVPMSLKNYMTAWTLTQYKALVFKRIYPDRVHILRLEDIITDPLKTLGELCQVLCLEPSSSLEFPSWNGIPLTQVYPWGTIRSATPEVNRKAALELPPQDQEEIRVFAGHYLDALDYGGFLER